MEILKIKENKWEYKGFDVYGNIGEFEIYKGDVFIGMTTSLYKVKLIIDIRILS